MSKKNKGNAATQHRAFVLPKDALVRVNLGQAFAEYDPVLIKPGVFVRTPALNAAIDASRSKCFFVGRRGTGKTAITRFLGAQKNNVVSVQPELFATLSDVLNPEAYSDINNSLSILSSLASSALSSTRFCQNGYGATLQTLTASQISLDQNEI
jgi:hypothetical protein